MIAHPFILAVVFAAGVAAGGLGVYQLWSVDTLQTRVERQREDADRQRSRIAQLEGDADEAVRLAEQMIEEAADARRLAIQAEERSRELEETFRREEAARPDAVCGFSDADRRRLQSDIPIGRPRTASPDPRPRQ